MVFDQDRDWDRAPIWDLRYDSNICTWIRIKLGLDLKFDDWDQFENDETWTVCERPREFWELGPIEPRRRNRYQLAFRTHISKLYFIGIWDQFGIFGPLISPNGLAWVK